MARDPLNYTAETLGVSINRRRITPISGPSLVRHLVLWLPTGQAGDESKARAQRFDDLIGDVYAAIRTSVATNQSFETNSWNERARSIALFYSVLAANHPFEVTTVHHSRLHRAIKFWFDYCGVPISLSFDLHEEVATLTFILNCSDRLSPSAEDSAFADAIKKAFALVETRSHWHEIDIHTASNRLFFDFWSELDNVLFPDGTRLLQQPVLLDARGLILTATEGGEAPEEIVLAKPFSQLRTSEQNAPARIAIETKPLTPAGISHLLPLLTCRMDSTVEYTLSSLMGGRALYTSCLGSGPDNIDAAASSPITYLLLADAYNSWQLGRLTYRIHRAGAARLAATQYFEVLRQKAEAFRSVERDLEDALSKSVSAKAIDKSEIEAARDDALDTYKDVEQRLDKILNYGKNEALTYRINRSRYYVRQFRRAAKAMRVKRVEGFQPYDEYVEQRQGSAFEFLDLLGQRYDRLQSDRSLLLRRIQVFNAQINETEISLAQWTADAALFVVLGPYYAAHVLVEIFFNWIGGEHGLGARMLWAGCLLFGIVCFVARQEAVNKHRKKGPWRRMLSWRPSRRLLSVVAIALLCLFTFYVLARTLPGNNPSDAGSKQQSVLEQ